MRNNAVPPNFDSVALDTENKIAIEKHFREMPTAETKAAPVQICGGLSEKTRSEWLFLVAQAANGNNVQLTMGAKRREAITELDAYLRRIEEKLHAIARGRHRDLVL